MSEDTDAPLEKPRRLLITGTGTGVGKTHVSKQLLAFAPGGALGLKPIESGFEPLTSDAQALAAPGRKATLPLYALRQPASPHLAARRQGLGIDLHAVRSWIEACEAAADAKLTIVETAGGLFTPLAEQGGTPSEPLTNRDLVRALMPCDWVLVAPDRLGVLHDVLATRAAARSTLGDPQAIILTSPEGPNDLQNATELRRFCREPVLEAAPTATLFARLSPHLSRNGFL
jgi:dethiobiotin synthetase